MLLQMHFRACCIFLNQRPPVWRLTLPLTHFPLNFRDLRTCQGEDPELMQIIENLVNRVPTGKYVTNKWVLHCRSRCNGKSKVVVPSAVVPVLFGCYHISPLGGQLGISKNINTILKSFVWKSMESDTANCVRHCTVYGLTKPVHLTSFGFLHPFRNPLSIIWGNFPGESPGIQRFLFA